MSSEKHNKLNPLLRAWPNGTVGTLPWLETKGVYQQLAYKYEKSGWLERVGNGAYIKAGDQVSWPGAVHAIQTQLSLPIHVGGKSALELRGLEHFVSVGKGSSLCLFSPVPQRLPTWFLRHPWDREARLRLVRLFNGDPKLGLTHQSFGAFEIEISSPERAILEVLNLVPKAQGFEEARLLMEGLVGLRPRLVQELLEKCRSIKAKRLFLYFAEAQNHSWLKKVNRAKIKLGGGKRVIVPGGSLDSKYQITVERLEEGQPAA